MEKASVVNCRNTAPADMDELTDTDNDIPPTHTLDN